MLSQFQLSPEKRSRCNCYFHCHAVVNGKSSSPHGYYYIKQVVQLNIYMLQFCWQIHHLCRRHNFLFHVIWLGFFVVRALASLVVDYFVFFLPHHIFISISYIILSVVNKFSHLTLVVDTMVVMRIIWHGISFSSKIPRHGNELNPNIHRL